jgi:anti-sigma regulatory factor (Ser/Thr protein kinase)
MILVQRIDLEAGRVTLEMSGDAWPCAEPRRTRLAAAAAGLGVREVCLRADGGREDRVELATAARTPGGAWPLLAHEATRTPTGLRYSARLAHRAQAYRGILAYTELVLHAADAPAADIGIVRLVTYELCVNAVEHGRPLHADPTLEIGFTIGAEAVHGWVRDNCARFDPVGFRPNPVVRLVREHTRRGYGLRIVQRAVDALEHVHDGHGNLVSFTKEFTHEAAT